MLIRATFCVLFVLTTFTVNARSTDPLFYDTSGTQLEYIDVGSGKETLVIESGVGAGVSYWLPVIEGLSTLDARIIVYSRAGNGASTKANDLSFLSSNKRLKLLLSHLGVKDKVIMVGHSFGGFHVRTFAANFPEMVKGLVLLDPSHEKFDSELSKIDEVWAKRDAERLNGMLCAQPEWAHLQSVYAEKAIPDNNITQELPTIVVTSSQLNESDWWIGHSEKAKDAWRVLHQTLIEDNRMSAHLVTKSAGHNIPREDLHITKHAIKILIYLTSHGSK